MKLILKAQTKAYMSKIHDITNKSQLYSFTLQYCVIQPYIIYTQRWRPGSLNTMHNIAFAQQSLSRHCAIPCILLWLVRGFELSSKYINTMANGTNATKFLVKVSAITWSHQIWLHSNRYIADPGNVIVLHTTIIAPD